MVECMLIVWKVIGLIPHGGPIELLVNPASATQLVWYVLYCLWDSAYKRCIAVNQKE